MVKDFNIHLLDLDVSTNIQQITFDGEENVIFNGITDWLHAVEITDDDCLIFWSDDSKSIVYGQLDQYGTSNFEYNVYLTADQTIPKRVSLPYPKPGTKLPKISLFYFDLTHFETIDADNFKTTRLDVEISEEIKNWGAKTESEWATKGFYLNIARWIGNEKFQVQFKNRNENEAITEHCSLSNDKFVCEHQDVQTQKINSGWLGGHKPSDTIES